MRLNNLPITRKQKQQLSLKVSCHSGCQKMYFVFYCIVEIVQILWFQEEIWQSPQLFQIILMFVFWSRTAEFCGSVWKGSVNISGDICKGLLFGRFGHLTHHHRLSLVPKWTLSAFPLNRSLSNHCNKSQSLVLMRYHGCDITLP